MVRGSEYTFFQTRHTDGQKAHKKMVNITNHQGSANQNHNEILPQTYQNVCYQKDKKSQVLAKITDKKELCSLLTGM